jgi:dTDP-4-amino-4,6-dideoxygalactose transaminase
VKLSAPVGVIPVNDLNRRVEPFKARLAQAMKRVVDSGWYILGPTVSNFEQAFAGYCGVSDCIGVANGTDALEIALRACGAGPGKQIITVANAGGYSSTAILATGAEPCFIDIDPDTLLIDAAAARRAVNQNTAALIATHLYGRMAEMAELGNISVETGIPVIEDCAQAHGAKLDGKRAGSSGACGCFSFYPTKNLGALGDGGAVVTNNSQMAERIRELRQYGWREKYRSAVAGGRNSRLDEVQAACLLEQLPSLDGWNGRRRDIARRYSEELRSCGVSVPDNIGEDYVAHLYVVRPGGDRGRIRKELAAAGVGTDIHYPVPDHRQDAWKNEAWAAVSLPKTERACDAVLTLPCFPELADEEVSHVIRAVRDCVGRERGDG